MILYVAYTAKAANGTANGYVILRDRHAPKSQEDIERICQIISANEGLTNVIPVFWQELAN